MQIVAWFSLSVKQHFFPIHLVIKKVEPAENALKGTLFLRGKTPPNAVIFIVYLLKYFTMVVAAKCSAADGITNKNISAHSDSLIVRHAYFFKTYECKYQRYIRISQGIMCIAVIWGIMRKMRQCLQFSCTWATKPWNHWWKRATKSRNLGSKPCNWALHLVSLAVWTWMYSLFRRIIHYRLIIYSPETLKYGQLTVIQKKTLVDLPLANN